MNFRIKTQHLNRHHSEEIAADQGNSIPNIFARIEDVVRKKLAYFLLVGGIHTTEIDRTVAEPLTKIPEGKIFPIEELLSCIKMINNTTRARIRTSIQTGIYEILLNINAGIRKIQKKAIILDGDNILVQEDTPFIPCQLLNSKRGQGVRFSLRERLQHPEMQSYMPSNTQKYFYFDPATGTITIYEVKKIAEGRMMRKKYPKAEWPSRKAILENENILPYEKEFLGSLPSR